MSNIKYIDVYNIPVIDRLRLLKEYSYYKIFGIRDIKFDENKAKEFLNRLCDKKYINYYEGVSIKTNLCGDKINAYFFDKIHGEGSMREALSYYKNPTYESLSEGMKLFGSAIAFNKMFESNGYTNLDKKHKYEKDETYFCIKCGFPEKNSIHIN